MITWIIIAVIILIIVVRVVYELHHLKTTQYELRSGKIPQGSSLRVVFLSDLHQRIYGSHNEELFGLIADQKPDLILLGGDMLLRKSEHREDLFYELLEKLPAVAPVYYAPGNHETALRDLDPADTARFDKMMDKCAAYGVHYLANETVEVSVSDKPVRLAVSGFDPPLAYYIHSEKCDPTASDIENDLGRPDPSVFSILLAHPPALFDEYVKYGPDLVLSGHYHGGAIRFGSVGLVSPQVKFFPKYSAGKYTKEGTTMIVTRGVGSHSVNLRLFNYPEIVILDIKG